MSAVKIDPMKLLGPWADGYVLERQHTLTSEFLGHDSFGNPQFDTKRTELGELVFRLKNRNDKNTLDPIAETAPHPARAQHFIPTHPDSIFIFRRSSASCLSASARIASKISSTAGSRAPASAATPSAANSSRLSGNLPCFLK